MDADMPTAAERESEIGRIQHISLCIRDEAEARAFYTGLLGLKEAPRPSLPMAGLWLQVGSMQVHLLVPPDPAELPRPRTLARTPIAAHTAFEVVSLEPIISRLRALKIDVILSDIIEGQAFLTDPSGNIIELNAPVATSTAGS